MARNKSTSHDSETNLKDLTREELLKVMRIIGNNKKSEEKKRDLERLAYEKEQKTKND